MAHFTNISFMCFTIIISGGLDGCILRHHSWVAPYVIAAMLDLSNKRLLIIFYCLDLQHGCHVFVLQPSNWQPRSLQS